MCRKRKESSAKERERLQRGSKAGSSCLARMTCEVEQSKERTEMQLALALAVAVPLSLLLAALLLTAPRADLGRLSSGASRQTFDCLGCH